MISTRTLTDQTSGDPYFANVSLLLHMDGTNGSTTFTDSSSNGLTVTATAATTSTTNAKSGFGQVYTPSSASTSKLSINYATVLNFATGNFTFEGWIYPTASTGVFGIYGTSGGSGSNRKFVVHLNNLTPSIHYNTLTNGNNIYTAAKSSVPVNAWSYIAFIRNGTAWTWYINGTAAGTGSNSTDLTFTNENTFVGYGGESYFAPFVGNLDDIRLTKGTARTITSTPTGPFPNP